MTRLSRLLHAPRTTAPFGRPPVSFGVFSMAMGFLFAPVAAAQVSEADFLTDLPVIYSVTRLPQAQADTPGAVTIVDREMIRRSGAREVADLLRLVPGYLMNGWNGANPAAAYHAALDEYGGRNQVFIDGRSVYSTYYLGDTHRGTMGLLLEDIERIEVLRGSNSASYGANAMLGVINIVARHAADSQGAMISVTAGQGDTRDVSARYGWQSPAGSYRLSAGSRNDSGYLNAHDDKQLNQIHFRGDLAPSAASELTLMAGMTDLEYGDGFAGNSGHPVRTSGWMDAHAAMRWRLRLDNGDELAIAANLIEEHFDDRYDYATLPGLVIDFSGTGRRHSVEFQHSLTPSEQLRAVWGIALSRDGAYSTPLYVQPSVAFSRTQVFGNLEWRPDKFWVVNAGGLVERHSAAGSEFAPRLGVNYHLTPAHTLRASVTRSFRMPSPYELRSDVRYYIGDLQVGRGSVSRGNLRAERADSREIGYLGEFQRQRMTLDIRVFEERLTGLVGTEAYDLLPSLPVTGTATKGFANESSYRIHGLEYQWRWKPQEGLELIANQAFLRASAEEDASLLSRTPRYVGTLSAVKQLSGGLELSGIFSAIGALMGMNQVVEPTRRLDLRLAHRFRVGANRAEAALTLQAANGDYPAYDVDHGFMVQRRAFASLRLNF